MSFLPADLSIPYILSFLTTHDWNDCVNFFGKDEIDKTLEPDLEGTITLYAKEKTFNIHLGKIHNASTWDYELCGTKFRDLADVQGKLYTAKGAKLPTGDNQCWLQQHRGQGDEIGRTVIEFYTNKVITAIFKTDVNNYGAEGCGTWSEAS